MNLISSLQDGQTTVKYGLYQVGNVAGVSRESGKDIEFMWSQKTLGAPIPPKIAWESFESIIQKTKVKKKR